MLVMCNMIEGKVERVVSRRKIGEYGNSTQKGLSDCEEHMQNLGTDRKLDCQGICAEYCE